jgi:hypothetical protein
LVVASLQEYHKEESMVFCCQPECDINHGASRPQYLQLKASALCLQAPLMMKVQSKRGLRMYLWRWNWKLSRA